MTTVVVIVCVKVLLVCLHGPELLTRVGSWIVVLANHVGRAFVREPSPEPVIPPARVIRR